MRIKNGFEIGEWFHERVPRDVSRLLGEKGVPGHRQWFWYLMGGLTAFFFLIQIVTGILLALNYIPTADQAYESVNRIISVLPHGWLVRSIHAWSSNLMIGTLLVHMFSAFFMKAYRKPRELMWLSGVALLLLILGFAFTGYLLPWDTTAFFATYIGTEIPKSMPLVGELSVRFLRGGAEIGSETLSRMFSIHTIILPLVTVVLVGFHLLYNQVSGVSTPIHLQQESRPIPFFPNFMLRDLIAWVSGLLALLLLAILVPWGLGEKANAFASAPPGIHPEWYFLPLYETLRLVPATIFSINSELLVNLLVGAGVTFWLLVPFLDRKAKRGLASPVFTVIGLVVVAYLVITILLAYTT